MDDVEERHTLLREITNTQTQDSTRGNHSKPSMENQQKYVLLMKQARKAAEEGHPRDSLQLLLKAAKIMETEKVQKRIEKLQKFIKENGSESESDEDNGLQHVGKGFYLHKALYDKLYSYQREALLWFWRLHRRNKGGILGDDMGLGKTIQVISFLSGLFNLEQVKTVLIVLPVALIINWEKEFDKWSPGICVESHHSNSKRERERALARVQRRGGVLLTSYGLVLTNHELLSQHHGSTFTWDYVILDEGHKIKNPSKTTKAVHKVPATHRIILTGTPVQNNLKELWSLFDFVTQGTLLGTAQTFKSEYANPITRAREKDATGGERLLGNQMAESLRELIVPYFLRRTKADVVKRREESSQNANNEDSADNSERIPEFPTLTRKNDFVVWLHLTPAQIKIYQDFISLDQVKELLMTSRSPLVELTILKKLCDHPRLLPVRACIQLGLETPGDACADDDEEDDSSKQTNVAAAVQSISDEVLMTESCKLQFLIDLLTNLRHNGHRTLVFSQSRKMLDIIQKVLENQDFRVMRLDGTISKLEDREKRISTFQHNDEITVFLLTTQVGGVGLTLTGADRVVIFDPSWNPATDSQAVDRVYRIGQTRSVVVYRLITCSTVEEKIYRRQIFKDSLTKQATGMSKNPYRYFSRQELRDLFILENPRTSATQLALQEMHAAQRKTDTQLDEHIAFLYSLGMFGISDHDLMFSQEADSEKKEDQEQSAEYIHHRVTRAKELVSAESDLSQKLRVQIEQNSEEPGSMQRHHEHRQYTDRQKLLEHAAQLGEQVNVPAFNKRRDDYDRKHQSESESEEEDDFDASLANLTLDDLDGDAHLPVAKNPSAVRLLGDRPPSSRTAHGTSIICVEDSEDEDGNQLTEARKMSESDVDIVQDSDTEDTKVSPKISGEKSFVSPRGEDILRKIQEENAEPMLDEASSNLTGTQENRLFDGASAVSQTGRLKRLASTPNTSLEKMGRFSQTPQSKAPTPANHKNSPYTEGDSVGEVPPTPGSFIDLTDSDADMSQSYVEVEERNVATSPLANSRMSQSPDSPSRPISSATVGAVEKNVDSDYYMESEPEEEEEVKQPSHAGRFPPNQEVSEQDESFERSQSESPFIEQRNVALSPMIQQTASESSQESASSTPNASPCQSLKKDPNAVDQDKATTSDNPASKTARYHSDTDPGYILDLEATYDESNMTVTRKLSFGDKSICPVANAATSKGNPTGKVGDLGQDIFNEEDEDEAFLNRSDDEEQMTDISDLERSMSKMAVECHDQAKGDDSEESEDEKELEDNSEEEEGSNDDILASRSRRPGHVIEDSEEESDNASDEEKDTSRLENSSAADNSLNLTEHQEDNILASRSRQRGGVIEDSEEESDNASDEGKDTSRLENSSAADDSHNLTEHQEDNILASRSRQRGGVIEDSEEESDNASDEGKDTSRLENSSAADDSHNLTEHQEDNILASRSRQRGGVIEDSEEESDNASDEGKDTSRLENSSTADDSHNLTEHQEDNILASRSRQRGRVIEDSEEESDNVPDEGKDTSRLENSSAADDSQNSTEHQDDTSASRSKRRGRVIEDSEEESDNVPDEGKDTSRLENSSAADDSHNPTEHQDDTSASRSRQRGRVIEDSEEESDNAPDKGNDASRLENSSADDSHNMTKGHDEDNSEGEMAKNTRSTDHEEESEEDGEYEDSFIDDDEAASDDENSGSDEDYQEEEGEDEGSDGAGGEQVELTDEEHQRYQALVERGRLHQSNGNIKKALRYYLKALDIDGSDKELERRTYKLAQQFKQQEQSQ